MMTGNIPVVARRATLIPGIRQHMRCNALLIALIVATLPCGAAAASTAVPSCTALLKFVWSVKPGGIGQVVFHASWGTNFQDTSLPNQERCSHHGNVHGKTLCAQLVAHDTYKEARNSVKWIADCLSPGTVLAPSIRIDSAAFVVSVGNKMRGGDVSVEYHYEEYAAGASVDLTLTAGGY